MSIGRELDVSYWNLCTAGEGNAAHNHAQMILLLIALGGAAGSVLRYFVGGRVQHFATHGFPVGTLSVNVIGCLLIGVLAQLFLNMQTSGPWRAVLMVGFCGGFTTFSTFSFETVGLIEGGDYVRALAYISLSVILCLAATFAGMTLMRTMLSVGHAR
jgi:CrcB protein